MSFLTKLKNVFRRARLQNELDEELHSHLAEAAGEGRSAEEVRRSFGNYTNTREASRDLKIFTSLDNLRSDVVFGLRQLSKNKIATAAAVLSLGLAIGACSASFRLIDALFLRPLPVYDPASLHIVSFLETRQDGSRDLETICEYPMFRMMREATANTAELFAIASPRAMEVQINGGAEIERAQMQRISGNAFPSFQLNPALGRLLAPSDDLKPGAHPVAVLSHAYWTSRFQGNSDVLNKTITMERRVYTIIGVAPEGFTGTETGVPTDIFTSTMMNAEAINDPNWGWFRTWVRIKPGASLATVTQQLQGAGRAFRVEYVKQSSASTPAQILANYVNAPLSLQPASAGYSNAQRDFARPLGILATLVLLVLLIACANVANLLQAQGASRSREMALRVSIGAGRWRLIQLVIVESALLATAATSIGAAFGAWAAPSILSSIYIGDSRILLDLSLDWRVLLFSVLLTLAITILFGLAPALRASAVQPVSALKGGDQPHSRRRLMYSLAAAQVAFCFIVHFCAGLFVSSAQRLTSKSPGFRSEGLMVLAVNADDPHESARWQAGLTKFAEFPGVQSVGVARWGLLAGNRSRSQVALPGQPFFPRSPWFLEVSSGFLDTMKIPLTAGRDFRPNEANPNVAIVSESFAKRYFAGANPVGKSFQRLGQGDKRVSWEIIGLVRDAAYSDLREENPATMYIPMLSAPRRAAAYVVRAKNESGLSNLMPALRAAVPSMHPGMRVLNLISQDELMLRHTIRERLLARLSAFFGVVALVLAAIGLFGVLDYSVLQRRREFGIRIALGARGKSIAWSASSQILATIAIGAFVGIASGRAIGALSSKLLENLLYGVQASDWRMITLPVISIALAALVAAVPPILRALRIDPAKMLRAE